MEMIIHKNTKQSVSKLLGMSINGNEQDWEIEFADKNRVEEFIKVATITNLTANEKDAIVALILYSYDDFLSCIKENNNKIWLKITALLDNGNGRYDELLNYLAVWEEENKDDLFAITPLIRQYLQLDGK